MGTKRLNLLVIASRPSDYAEMSDLAKALAARRHRVTLLYFYSESDPGTHAAVLLDMKSPATRAVGIVPLPADVDGVGYGTAASPAVRESPIEQLPTPAAKRRRLSAEAVLKRSVRWARRRGWIQPKTSRARQLVFAVANTIDTGFQNKGKLFLTIAPVWMVEARVLYRFYKAFVLFYQGLIKENRFDAILIPEDVVGYIWPTAIKAAHANKIPALVFPYTLANREEPLRSLRNEPAFQTESNPQAARFCPKWRLREDGADLMRLPQAHVFAHEWLRIAPPDPWMMNSGYADAICVDSQASLEYFRVGGIPPSQMQTAGSVSQDFMFELRRDRARHLEQLRRELGLAGEKPLLLLSGCPNQLTAQVPHCEFTDFDGIAAFVGESLTPLAADYHLVVRPHPNFPEFGPMLSRYGFSTAAVPTSRLVPLADLFVAFASATIRWSIACAVPTVNYDVFHYGYDDFASAAGVVSVDDKDRFRATVRALRPDTDRYAQLLAAIRGDSARWSMMDGHCTDRIEAAIFAARERRAGGRAARAEGRSA